LWQINVKKWLVNQQRTLKNAVKKRKPQGDLMLHTDRGVEYRCHVYQAALKRSSITHSLSRAGKCTDNAQRTKPLRGIGVLG